MFNLDSSFTFRLSWSRDEHQINPACTLHGRNTQWLRCGFLTDQPGFGGACPPVEDKPHRYQFTVWALKADKLPLDNQASGALVGYMLNANVLAEATITSTYGR
ncbi:hypothetical protein [Pseudomonas sp. JAI120]|uniref:hypothetical protein n=1 Tax=Pseudomonas sp. JAI120 TaxID=2723063 RepID=UPI00403F75B0